MFTRKTNKWAAALVIGTALGCLGVSPVFAQTAPGASATTPAAPPAQAPAGPAAGCFVAPAALSAAEISAFIASPSQLLTDFPTAGLPMANRVRSLAGSSADVLAALTGLVGRANPSQVAAIGAGLARAARACAAINPLYAAQIQEAVAGTPFETAFLSASAETQTAALGAAGAGAGAGGAPAGAIGGAGAGTGPGTGLNGTAGAGGGVASGDSAFAANAGSRFFASSGAGSTTIIQGSPTVAPPAQ